MEAFTFADCDEGVGDEGPAVTPFIKRECLRRATSFTLRVGVVEVGGRFVVSVRDFSRGEWEEGAGTLLEAGREGTRDRGRNVRDAGRCRGGDDGDSAVTAGVGVVRDDVDGVGVAKRRRSTGGVATTGVSIVASRNVSSVSSSDKGSGSSVIASAWPVMGVSWKGACEDSASPTSLLSSSSSSSTSVWSSALSDEDALMSDLPKLSRLLAKEDVRPNEKDGPEELGPTGAGCLEEDPVEEIVSSGTRCSVVEWPDNRMRPERDRRANRRLTRGRQRRRR